MSARSMALAATALSVVFVVGVGGQPALAYYQIDLRMHSGYRWTIDVDPTLTIDDVKLRVLDRMGIFPPDMCLVFNNKFLVPSRQLADYNIQAGVIDVFEVPAVSRWSITPDEPTFGGIVSNVVETVPAGTYFEIVDGSLPAGVALDADTGVVTGSFAASGDFSATIRATTVCGDSDLTWAGTVATADPQSFGTARDPRSLPDTGTDGNLGSVVGSGAAALIIIGSSLVARRRLRFAEPFSSHSRLTKRPMQMSDTTTRNKIEE